jgi:hypothetical protein
MRSPRFHLRAVFTGAAFFLLCIRAEADWVAVTKNPYPNELQGLKLYARYLAPLIPLQSERMQVVQVLGSNEDIDSKDWKVTVLYSCTDDSLSCTHGPRNDLVGSIEMFPKHRVSFLQIKMPLVFCRSVGGVSEINVACDIYSDDFGLEYWVVSGNSPSHKNGDLLMIRYGPTRDSPRKIRRN